MLLCLEKGSSNQWKLCFLKIEYFRPGMVLVSLAMVLESLVPQLLPLPQLLLLPQQPFTPPPPWLWPQLPSTLPQL